MGRGVAVFALVMLAPLARSAAQEPWPGAVCYELTRLAGARTDRQARGERRPDAPDLIVLDSARRGALLGTGDKPDTVGRVVHGLVRNRQSSTLSYSSYGGDRWFSGWTRPTPDSVTVTLGTGHHPGLDLRFRVDGDRLVAVVGSGTDNGEAWTARLIGRRARCPAAPPRLSRLRLRVSDGPGVDTPYDLPLPELDVELSTEAPAQCGSSIDYTAMILDTLLAITLQGLAAERACAEPAGRATTRVGAMLRPGHYTMLIGTPAGSDTNRFVLTVTDSSTRLTTLRSTFVTADEGVRPRPVHNLFVLRCRDRPTSAICDAIERWLVGLPGISRVGTFPYRKQLSESTWAAPFRYDSSATLARVRACMVSIAQRIRPTAGVYVRIRTWLGEEIEASSERDDAPQGPAPSVGGGACAG
jgi:hypothetical protein